MKHHVKTLVALVRSMGIDSLVGAEVGVWRGGMSADLLREFPSLVLMMIDPWEGAVPGLSTEQETNEAFVEAMAVTKFAEDRRIVCKMTSEQASVGTLDECLDFAFVDALHDYESVKRDIALWHPKVKPGGLLSGHDYGGSLDRRGKGGVKKAVDEFCQENGYGVWTSRINWWIWKR